MSDAPKVILRSPTPGDRDRLRDWRNRPAVAQWMYSDHKIGEAEHQQWFVQAMADTRRRYWIVEAAGAPVGLANLYDIDPANHKAAWAYYLAADSIRGQGVGAFVEFWVIEHAFEVLGLTRLWCEVLAENEAVWQLHESFGFRREALLRRHVWRGDLALDVVGLGLLAEDWRFMRPGCLARLRSRGFEIPD